MKIDIIVVWWQRKVRTPDLKEFGVIRFKGMSRTRELR
jgi:hypothetical protein